eukprot:CAMPEP_0175166014 /NCGR_PEP_ID=MMETSP0087-20121206/27441_1 /TAXON_ID=136419 /ORGANISM="Unknown Unknown, Strain D1" /LENGTH=42 /DNA_ID= /DNA_START= /DNA_END= /DNA_ORIENTATION=
MRSSEHICVHMHRREHSDLPSQVFASQLIIFCCTAAAAAAAA